jgi:predicted dehydrogenase
LLLQKGSHDIDILHWLCGGYTEKVTAFGGLTLYDQITDRRDGSEFPDVCWYDENWPPLSQKKLNPVIDVEDLNMVLMRLDNGVFASYQQCHYTPDSWRNYCIIGTEGRIENFGDEPGKCVVKLWDRRESYNPEGHERFEIPFTEGTHGGADSKIVAEFIQYIRENVKIKTSAIAARNSVAAGYAATMSLRNGGMPVEIPPLAKEIEAYFTN